MQFFHKDKVVLYLRNNILGIYKIGQEQLSIEFPDSVIQNQEIKDIGKLEQLIGQSLEKSGLEKQSALLVLSEEAFYHKIIPVSDKENEQDEIQKFLDQIPFEKPNVATKIVANDTEMIIFAAHKNFFYEIKNIFEKYGWNILAVVPAGIFGSFQAELSDENLETILDNSAAIKDGNFLGEDPESDILIEASPSTEEETKSKNSTKKTLILLFILVLIVLSAVLFAGQKFGFLKINSLIRSRIATNSTVPIASLIPEATSSATPESTSSAVATNINKEDAKVQILNGSGVAGQATKLKDKISTLGYKNIETGNSTESGVLETTVYISPKISSDDFKELKTLLESLFNKVAVTTDSVDNFDISITTGESTSL